MSEETFRWNDRTILIVLLLLALALIGIITLLRMPNPYPVGEETHDILRNAELLRKGQHYDSLKQEMISYDLFTLLFSGLGLMFSSVILAKLVSPVIGLLCLAYFFLLLREMRISKTGAALSAVLFIISPFFIYFSYVLNSDALILLFSIMLAYFAVSGKRQYAAVLLILLAFSNPAVALVAAAILVLYLRPKIAMKYYFILAGAIGAAALLNLSIYYTMPIAGLSNPFVEFGAPTGVSVPLAILAVIGIFLNWKGLLIRHRLAVPILLLLSFFYQPILILTSLLFIIYAGQALLFIFTRKWDLVQIRSVSLLLMLCTLLFSTLSYIRLISDAAPSADLIRSIKNIPVSQGRVATHSDFDTYIYFYANRKVVTEQDHNISQLFLSRNLEESEHILKDQEIDTFFLTSALWSGQVWNKEDSGFLLILRNSNKFHNAYRLERKEMKYEVWAYRPKTS